MFWVRGFQERVLGEARGPSPFLAPELYERAWFALWLALGLPLGLTLGLTLALAVEPWALVFWEYQRSERCHRHPFSPKEWLWEPS